MTTIDLEPAATRMSAVVAAIPDHALGDPTPCPAYTVGDLLDHVSGLTRAFTGAAQKLPESGGQGPSGDARRLGDDWRERIAEELAGLAAAWRAPAAWSGMTAAGSIEMPGEVAGLVVLDELVVHGWDLARATGQPFDAGPREVDACIALVAQFSGPGSEDERGDAFGPVVTVADDASALDRLVGLTGRDPRWSPR